MTAWERELIRELARRYREFADDPVNEERSLRIRHINGLKPCRPIVWIHEIPWHEMDIDGQLTLQCEDKAAREMEFFFRSSLFRWRYFQADCVLEKQYRVYRSWSNTNCGISTLEKINVLDDKNNIVSHHYEDQLDTEEKVAKLHVTTVTADFGKDTKAVEFAQDILGDILPVKLTGQFFGFAPWDTISTLRGVQPILMDLAMNPELMHATIRKFAEIGLSQMEQMEKLGLFSPDLPDVHCTPGYTDELPQTDGQNGRFLMKDTWFRGAAQIFTSVSPEMHQEFEIDYIKPLAERFGFTYYGCCEALHDRIDRLRAI